jgi:hypothetical protein
MIDKIDLFLECKYIIPSDKSVESWIGLKIDLLLYASISLQMMHTLWETCIECPWDILGLAPTHQGQKWIYGL